MGVSPVRKMGVSRRRNTTRPRPNPREVPCPLDLAANSLTAGSAGQARRAALPPASHRLANKPLPFPFNTFQPLPVPNAATHPYNQIGGCRSPVHPHPWRKMQKKRNEPNFGWSTHKTAQSCTTATANYRASPKKWGHRPCANGGIAPSPHTRPVNPNCLSYIIKPC